MTLTDTFGRLHRYLRISVTDRCNMRCRYCMPHEEMIWQPKEELLRYEEITRLAQLFVSMGVEKIRLTGGEPLVRKDIAVLIKMLADISGLKTLAITTNGTTLNQEAKTLKAAGLNSVTISLDTLRPDRFKQITQRDLFNTVMAGMETALSTGFESVKLNVVVMEGINDDELHDFVALSKHQPLNVRFIEYMPFKDNEWRMGKLVSYAKMKSLLAERHELTPIATHPSAVAKDFKIKNHKGSVSFVTSMTESFCGTCNRLRLTADGAIKPGLFDQSEVHLRDAMRNGADDAVLTRLIQRALSLKPAGHEPVETIDVTHNRPMITIGG